MRARTWAAVAAGAMLIGGVGACGVEGGNPTSECTDATRSAGAPGEAAPLLQLGDAPVVVYDDGAVAVPNGVAADLGGLATGFLRLPMMMPGYYGDQPGGFTAGSLTDCELTEVIEMADALFTDDVDFGDPQVTDSPTTGVVYRDENFSAYAFDRSDPTEWSDLSHAQEQARQDLADLWTYVLQQAELTDELPIDRLTVRTYGPVSEDEVADWPLSTPISELGSAWSCLTVTDPAEVEALLERIEEPLLEEQEYRIAVLALAPGVPACEG